MEGPAACEDEYRRLADSMPHLAWIGDADGATIWLNQRWYDYTGSTPEESLGWGWERVHDPADAAQVRERYRSVVQEAGAWEETVTIRRRDGEYRRFLSRAVPYRDETGRIVRWFGTNTDIEDSLRAIEDRERVFSIVPDMLCIASFDGRFLHVNPAFERTLGWSRENLTSHPFLELVHPDDRAATQAELEKLRRGEATIRFENRYRTSDGTYRLLAWAASPVVERGFLYAAARDITEHRAMEREREETLALLEQVISTVPIGLALFEPSFRYVRVNEALAHMNGLPAAEHIGKRIDEVVTGVAPDVEALLARVFENGEPILDVELVGATRAAPAEQRYRQIRVFPVKDRQGRIFAAGVLVDDITERKQAFEALQRSAEFRERFLGIVAHDLRTPLAAITSGAYLLLRMKAMPERGARVADKIAGSAKRMSRMITELLDFTRVRLGSGIPVECTPGDLAEVVRQVVDETAVAHSERTIHLRADCPCELPFDADRIAQVIGNLLGNALTYSPADTPVEVELASEKAGFRLEVRNRNKGPPIPTDQLRTLFDPFHRGDRARDSSREGLGLGLYIAREIVLAHGGTIEASSSEEGTSFTVRLRRSAAPTRPGGASR